MHKLIKICLFIAAAFICAVSAMFAVLNSERLISDTLAFYNSKTGNELSISKQKISISPKFKIYITFDELSFKSKNAEILNLKALKGEILPFRYTRFQAEELYLKKTLRDTKSKSRFDFNPMKIPDINLSKGKIELVKNNKPAGMFDLTNVLLKTQGDKKVASFNLRLASTMLSSPLEIHENNRLYLTKDGIETEDFNIFFRNGKFNLSGMLFNKISGPNFYIRGENLPAGDIEKSFLLFKKQGSNKKNFIENFDKFSGTLNANLHYTDGGLSGRATFTNLRANTVLFDIPVFFKTLVFDFNKKDVIMSNSGIFGGEKAETDLLITDIFTKNTVVSGSVKANLTKRFSKKYIPNLHIKNSINLDVDYTVENGTVDVLYTATLPAEADIAYCGTALGLSDKERILQASTRKEGDKIALISYAYSAKLDGGFDEIIYGAGDFEKINGKYTLKNLWGQTKKNAPVSLLGFLENRLSGGVFNGNLEYNFSDKCLTGSISLHDTKFKELKINDAAIFADNKLINILAVGTYLNEPFTCEIDLKNKLVSHLYVEKMDFYLKKYVMKKSNAPKKNKMPEFTEKISDYYPEVTIKNMNFMLEEFSKEKIFLQNITLSGAVDRGIFHFYMPSVLFAEGTLSALGFADIPKKTIDINFEAFDINSNIAAYQIFNLKDQIQGGASATLHLNLTDSLSKVTGEGTFRVKEGALLKIGSTEFIVKRAKKKHPYRFSISDIVKIDKSLVVDPNSDITGNFKLNNSDIKNINVYMQNDNISMFLEGNYNIRTELANLKLFGKYNRDIERKISVFHIPISWLFNFAFKIGDTADYYADKFKKVPSIKSKNEKNFSIMLHGNLNNYKSLTLKLNRVK